MYSRKPKQSALDTVYYEIEMLRYAADKLHRLSNRGAFGSRGTTPDSPDPRLEWVLIEGFLLHFRNLTHFFGSTAHLRSDDLSIMRSTEWAGRDLTDIEREGFERLASGLHDKWFKTISKYLQHCTTARHENDRTWDVHEMLGAIEPVLRLFETTFPRHTS